MRILTLSKCIEQSNRVGQFYPYVNIKLMKVWRSTEVIREKVETLVSSIKTTHLC